MFQRFDDRRQIAAFFGCIGRPQRNIIKRILRARSGNTQHLVKAPAQHGHKRKRAAKVKNIPLHRPPLSQAADGLIHYRIENTGGNIALFRPLVQQGLNVAFGKYAATGGDRVHPLMLPGQGVHISGIHIEKGGHLVDKSAGTPGTGAVHAGLHAAVAHKKDLRILSAQLDDAVCSWRVALCGKFGRIHFLHKRHFCKFGHAHAGAAGNGQPPLPLGGKALRHSAQHFHRFGRDL